MFGGSHHRSSLKSSSFSCSSSSFWHLLSHLKRIRFISLFSHNHHNHHQRISFSDYQLPSHHHHHYFTSNHNCNFCSNNNNNKMHTIGRSAGIGHHSIGPDPQFVDFRSEENLQKWRGFFIQTLEEIQRQTHSSLTATLDGLQYVESFILKLLGLIIDDGRCPAPTLHTTSDVEDRIKRIIPDPLKRKAIKKAKEILASQRNNRRSKSTLFHGNAWQTSLLKTSVEKFHNNLQKEVLFYKTDVHVSQYLLAVLEFIATDILQLAGHYVRNMTHEVITSQDIRVAMCADKYLMEIFSKDEDEDGPPSSANSQQSFFDSEILDGEYGQDGQHRSVKYSEAVHEFIQEERQFIRELSLIIKVFRDPLDTLGILTKNDLQMIFVNIDDIYEFSIKFLGLLEDAVEVADEDDCPAIGSCFLQIAEEEEMDVFHKYAQNVMNFSFRDHLYRVLSNHSIQINQLFSSLYNVDFLTTLKYVLPRLLLLPVYHCFSYFKAIEKLKELTTSDTDKENYAQADSTLQSLRNILEKEKKQNKFGDGYFLRLYGQRTHRATQLAKMKEIQTSIDNWSGKDIWQCCNEFIRDGILYKVSNPGKSISGHHFLQTSERGCSERRAFLFDGLLILCKLSTNKRTIVSGRGNDSGNQLRCKERFFIRNIEIIERDEPYVRTNFSSFNFGHGGTTANNDSMNQASLSTAITTGTPSSGNQSMMDQSLCSLSSSMSNLSMSVMNDVSTIHAFEISQPNQSIVLMTKTAEDKDSWMAQLILLNMRSILERSLDAKLMDEAKKHPFVLPHPSVYRFAIEDMETNIILEENKSNQNVPLIKGATLLKLVERLTYHKYGDPVLVKIFLTTYRTFCTPIELLKLLIERFEIPEPDFRKCMQAMHYANNEELASPTSMAPPAHEDGDTTGADSTGNSLPNTGPTSPTSPTMFNNNQQQQQTTSNHLPATPLSATDLNSQIFFDEQDEQCQHDYREMMKRFRKEYVQPVQFRVLNVLRHWIDKHWYDFERDPQLLEMLNEFLNEKLARSHTKVAKWCHHIRSVIDRAKNLQKTIQNTDQSDGTSIINFPMYNDNCSIQQQRSPILSSSFTNQHFTTSSCDEYDLLTCSTNEFATHLTLFEFELYKAVQFYEVVGMNAQPLVWTKKDKRKTSPNLLRMIKHHSTISNYFKLCIVETENYEERCAIVSRIIEILTILKSHNNFNGVSAIVAAFNSASVHRLEHTRAYVERNNKLKKNLEQAKALMEPHFKKYNEELFSINPPCVPFMGNFLTNIVHLEEGNSDYLLPPGTSNSSSSTSNAHNGSFVSNNSNDDNGGSSSSTTSPTTTVVSASGMDSPSSSENATSTTTTNQHNIKCIQEDVATTKLINFQKKRRVAETISTIQQYQNEPYNFKANNLQLWNFLQNLDSVVFRGMEDLSDSERDKKLEDYLFNKSLEIEPRNCKQPPKFPRKWPDRNLKQVSKSRNIRIPGLPGISHQSQSSFSESNKHGSSSHHQHSASASHINLHNNNQSMMMMDNQSMADTISFQQQQSPSLTPTTPPANQPSYQDAIFAPVMIGGGNGTNSAHISPTTPSLHTGSFFPSSFNASGIVVSGGTTFHHHHQHSSPHPTHSHATPGSSFHHQHQNSLPSPLISPPSSATAIFNHSGNNSETSTPIMFNSSGASAGPLMIPPPLPPKKQKPIKPCESSSPPPPPLPPKSHRIRILSGSLPSSSNNANTGATTTSPSSSTQSQTKTPVTKTTSYRDNRPPPLPPPIPPSSTFNHQHYHQRVNSDIVSSSATSPNHHNNNTAPPAIVRRNSTMDSGSSTTNCSLSLPPKKYSQQPPPLPPTTPTVAGVANSPKTPNQAGQQQQQSSPTSPHFPNHHHHGGIGGVPPLPPPSPNPAMSPPPASSMVPELPPKTYRLSNGHCR